MAGLSAATLAREGFKGAADALEGKHGFLNAYAPNPVPQRATQALGADWELMRTAVKPYPSCRYGHAGIDAALALRAELALQPNEIERVTLGLPTSGMLLVGAPAEKKANPQNVVDGQFSGPFVIAAALATGAMGWDSYAHLDDPAVRALLPRITCEHDQEAQAEFPANMAAKLTIEARGERVTRFVAVPKGEPGNFLTDADLRAKFAGLASPVLGADRASHLADALLAIDTAPNLGALMRLASPAVGARMAGD